MGGEEKEPKKRGSCMGKLMVLVTLGGLAALGLASWYVFTPQDLSDIAGRGPSAVGKKGRDLESVLSRGLEGGHPVIITEEELNLYLRDTLEMRQGGALAEQASIDDVLVRLEENRAEVVIVRTLAGRPFTLSMYLTVVQTETPSGALRTEILRNGGPYHESLPKPGIGGRFGKLPVPEGFLHLVLPSFSNLAAVYREPSDTGTKELNRIEQMSKIKIEKGRLLLDPRVSSEALQ